MRAPSDGSFTGRKNFATFGPISQSAKDSIAATKENPLKRCRKSGCGQCHDSLKEKAIGRFSEDAARPGIAPVRKLLAEGWHFEGSNRLFEKLGLDPKKLIDCQTLLALLAIDLFAELRGAPAWPTAQQIELLAEVHRRRQKSAVPLNDERVCQMIAKDKKSP